MPNKKISPIMEDKGLGIELPFDSGTDKKTGKPVKPVEQWDVEDFLAAGVNVFRNTSKSRVRNTATGTPGLRDTGITVKVDFKNWNFAK